MKNFNLATALFANVSVAVSTGITTMAIFFSTNAAHAQNNSNEMRDLVRQSAGLTPTGGSTAEVDLTKSETVPTSKNAADAVKQILPAAADKSQLPTYSEKESTHSQDIASIYLQAGASPEQAKQIREIRKSFDKSAKERNAEMLSLFKEMRGLTTQAELDEPKILAVQERINTAQALTNMEKTKTMISIRKILTAKQRENLATILKSRAEKQTEVIR